MVRYRKSALISTSGSSGPTGRRAAIGRWPGLGGLLIFLLLNVCMEADGGLGGPIES